MPLHYIARMNKSDEELNELYDLWFAQPNLELGDVDSIGQTVLEYAEKMPYRSDLIERIKPYAKR